MKQTFPEPVNERSDCLVKLYRKVCLRTSGLFIKNVVSGGCNGRARFWGTKVPSEVKGQSPGGDLGAKPPSYRYVQCNVVPVA